MSGDPKRCRERALKCRYLANEANTPQSKQMFLDLSQTWFRLAAELDDTNTFLNALRQWKLRMCWRMPTSRPRRQHKRLKPSAATGLSVPLDAEHPSLSRVKSVPVEAHNGPSAISPRLREARLCVQRSGSSLDAEHPSPSRVEWGRWMALKQCPSAISSLLDAERSPTVPTCGRASSWCFALTVSTQVKAWTWTEERRSTYSVLRVKWLGAYAP